MQQRAPYAFRVSDMGALSDMSGNPVHITADAYEFHPSHRPEFLSPPTEREYRASAPLDWPVIDYRESDLARLGPVEQPHKASIPGRAPRMFADGKWADRAAKIALAVSFVAVVSILIFEHFKGVA